MVTSKPHKQGDPAYDALQQVYQRDGSMKLAHFRRVM